MPTHNLSHTSTAPVAQSLPASSRHRHFLRPIAFRLIATLFGLMLSLFCLELTLRLAGVGSSILEKHEVIGQRYTPNLKRQVYVDEAKAIVDIRTNSLGFREREIKPRSDIAGNRIAVLGDSFVAGIAVQESQTMCRSLERIIREQPSSSPIESPRASAVTDHEVLNFGVSGFGTANELLTWRTMVEPTKPDVVILCFFNGNDLADNSSKLSGANRPVFKLQDRDSLGELPLADRLTLVPMSKTRTNCSRGLAECSRLYVWQRDAFRQVRDSWRQRLGTLPPGFLVFKQDRDNTIDAAWDVTEAMLVKLKQEVESTHAKFLVVQIPTAEQIVDEYWHDLTKQYQASGALERDLPEQRLADICARQQIELLSLAPQFRADGSGIRPAELYLGHGHWSEAGHQLAARLVAQKLAQLAPSKLIARTQ